MSAARKPWIKWYGADWRADPALRMCGFAARGLWIDILTLMQEAEPFGFLVVKGTVPTAKQLAALLGGQEREVVRLLGELHSAGVYSEIGGDVDDDLAALMPDWLPAGVIFSRRMVRDKAKADADAENGGRGGNPKLKPKPKPPVNQTDNQGVNPPDKAQSPEARVQKTPPDGGVSRARRSPNPKAPIPADWQPSETTTETLRSKGYSDHEIAWQRDRFHRHFTESRKQRPGWDASFINWVTSDPPGRHDPRHNTGGNGKQGSGLVANLNRYLDSLPDGEPVR